MTDALKAAQQALTRHYKPTATVFMPIEADRWILASILQKAIRRGETETARRAALTMLMEGIDVWRRLVIIAFEDVGIGSPDILAMTVASAADREFRLKSSESRVAEVLTILLAEAPKDRSADYLAAAADHPRLAAFLAQRPLRSVEEALERVADPALDLPPRAAAARSVLPQIKAVERPRLTQLMRLYADLGAPEDFVAITEHAAERTREAFVVVVPLIWLAAQSSPPNQSVDRSVLTSPIVRDVPLYALDMHTRAGRTAIARFARENVAVRGCLDAFCTPGKRVEVALTAAFYADAAPVARRLLWDGSEEIETFGKERDLCAAGARLEGVSTIIDTITENLEHLNAIRAELLDRQLRITGGAHV